MIGCAHLWNNWKAHFPDSPLVQEIQARISSYSKSDWEKMIEEAHILNDELGDLIRNNVPISDKRAEQAFDHLREHYDRWFCNFTQAYVRRISPAVALDPDFHEFFNQQAEGLSRYMPRLITYYSYKLPKE